MIALMYIINFFIQNLPPRNISRDVVRLLFPDLTQLLQIYPGMAQWKIGIVNANVIRRS
jgi:hypothetical protein